jgi:hypothetical protein
MRCSLHKFRAQTSTNPEWASELGEDFIGFARRKPVVDGSELLLLWQIPGQHLGHPKYEAL